MPVVPIVAPGAADDPELAVDDPELVEVVDEPVAPDPFEDPAAPREALPDGIRRPLTSTSWPTWRGSSARLLRRAYMFDADLSASPFLSPPPAIAGDGCVLPARTADSLVPDPGGAGDVTALPPPGAAPILALARIKSPEPDGVRPAVPTVPPFPSADCRQPVNVIVDSSLVVLEFCAVSPTPLTTSAANTAVCSLQFLFMFLTPLLPRALPAQRLSRELRNATLVPSLFELESARAVRLGREISSSLFFERSATAATRLSRGLPAGPDADWLERLRVVGESSCPSSRPGRRTPP